MTNAYYHEAGPLNGQTLSVPADDFGREYETYDVEDGNYQRQDNGDGSGPYYVFI